MASDLPAAASRLAGKAGEAPVRRLTAPAYAYCYAYGRGEGGIQAS